MRVAIIHPHLFVRGGGERLTKVLAAGLEKAGDEVAITTRSLKGGFPELNDLRRKFFLRGHSIRLRSAFFDNLGSLAFSIKEIIEAFEPDVVVSMTEDTVNLAISKLLNRKPRTIQYVHFPVEEEAHSSPSLYIDYFRFPGWFNRSFLRAADLIMCNSKYTQMAIKKAWKTPAEVVYPAIDYPFMKATQNIGRPRENVILCAGRFTRLKRQDFLVKAFRTVREKVKDARLILAGYPDGRHSYFLKGLLNHNEEGVEIHLSPSDHELIQLYSSAKVCCHPRIGEHFGLTPLEAMSQGAPVVAYDLGGIRETVVHGETGYLARNNDEFTRYTIQMLTLEHSKWAEMQRKAIQRAHLFSPDRFIARFRALAIPVG